MKYSHALSKKGDNDQCVSQNLNANKVIQGSWWQSWKKWIHNPKDLHESPTCIHAPYLEDAPGRYVKQQVEPLTSLFFY
jgi:poly(3-hydroxyalkanoate) synthetase